MRLSDLQNKEIVSIYNGKNIGNIIDATIDDKTGNIISFIIEPSKRSLFSFKKGIDTEISWKSIERIGEDVILVKNEFNIERDNYF